MRKRNWLLRLLAACMPRSAAGDRALIAIIRARNLTYLSTAKLTSLANACRTIERESVEGLFIEAGCALGGSAILISRLKPPGRRLAIHDVFGQIPPPTPEDTDDVHDRYQVILKGESTGIGGDRYYGYEENLFELVQRNLADFGVDCERDDVRLVRGLVQDTLQISEPVALAHIDVDWYEPVMTCLRNVVPNLSVGGILILDDYHDWGGCRKAVDEYFHGLEDQFDMDDSAGSLKLVRRAVARSQPRQMS